MKRSTFFLTAAAYLIQSINGFGSTYSTFTKSLRVPVSLSSASPWSMYDSSGPKMNDDEWKVLADTEQWLGSILGKPEASNPYTRKELSYAAELSDQDAMIVAGLWGRFKEARLRGEAYSATLENAAKHQDASFRSQPNRETHIIIVPNSELFDSFPLFDKLVEKLSQCRKNAREYIYDIDEGRLKTDKDWSVVVNCGHMHPAYGGNDANTYTNEGRCMLARRSPYPLICIEVGANPPTQRQQETPRRIPKMESQSTPLVSSQRVRNQTGMTVPSNTTDQAPENQGGGDDSFTLADLERLEKLFYKTAFDSAPAISAEMWAAFNDDDFDPEVSSFSSLNVHYADECYEMIFTNIAITDQIMQQEVFVEGPRQYLILPSFMSSSAVSFERFSADVASLISTVPTLANKLKVEALHPDHRDPAKRCPIPALVLAWRANRLMP